MSNEPDLLGDGAGFDSVEEWIGALQGEVISLREELERERDARRSFMVAATEFGNVNLALTEDRDRMREELAFVGFAVAPDGRAGVIEEHEIVPLAKALRAERDRLRDALGRAQRTVTAFASVIKCGERWSPACEDALGAALDGGDRT